MGLEFGDVKDYFSDYFFCPWQWSLKNSHTGQGCALACISSVALTIFTAGIIPLVVGGYWLTKTCCLTLDNDERTDKTRQLQQNLPNTLNRTSPGAILTTPDIDAPLSTPEKGSFAETLQQTQKRLGGSKWLDIDDTLKYLCNLTAIYPHFSPLPYFSDRMPDRRQVLERMNEKEVEAITNLLITDSFQRKKTLYALPLQINGNHRVIVIVDLINHTVEYWNSFGGDQKNDTLKNLATKLSQKTRANFKYINKTMNTRLQPDSYNCGVWVCRFVESRCQKDYVNASEFRSFDISKYRTSLIEIIARIRFFEKTMYKWYDKEENLREGDTSALTQGQQKILSSFRASRSSMVNQWSPGIGEEAQFYYDYSFLWDWMFHAQDQGNIQNDLAAAQN